MDERPVDGMTVASSFFHPPRVTTNPTMNDEANGGAMTRHLKAVTIALVALTGVASGCGSSGNATTTSATNSSAQTVSDLAPIHGTYSPSIDPANFVGTVDNRYFPLKPGIAFPYKGVQED